MNKYTHTHIYTLRRLARRDHRRLHKNNMGAIDVKRSAPPRRSPSV